MNKSKAFMLGFIAGATNAGYDTCQYEPNYPNWRDWMVGYESASQPWITWEDDV